MFSHHATARFGFVLSLLISLLYAVDCSAQYTAGTNGIPSLNEMTAAETDVWAEAALKQPGGPSYEFFAKLIPPLRYVDANFRCYPIVLCAPSNKTKSRLVSDGSS